MCSWSGKAQMWKLTYHMMRRIHTNLNALQNLVIKKTLCSIVRSKTKKILHWVWQNYEVKIWKGYYFIGRGCKNYDRAVPQHRLECLVNEVVNILNLFTIEEQTPAIKMRSSCDLICQPKHFGLLWNHPQRQPQGTGRYYMHELNISRHAPTQCRVPVGLNIYVCDPWNMD
jgi:hypothetical protein